MSKKYVKMEFCELPLTPWGFNVEKFRAGDEKQAKIYKSSKKPNRDKSLTYEEVTDEKKKPNYARIVPKNCCFKDMDNPHEFEQMKKIILCIGLKCLILETPHGGQFTFRTPDFYKKEMTKATDWLGYEFDCKATTDEKEAVQIMRVCGMDRKEIRSWDGKEVILEELDIDELDVLPFWLFGKLKDKDLHKEGHPGESEYTLKDQPFTQLIKMREGSRHDHIFNRCSMFALTNGFTIDEFKTLIQVIHDEYLVKIGTPMSESDLFSDLEERWKEYETTMLNNGWSYDESVRLWKKVKTKKEDKIDERRAAEYLYKQYDFYVRKPKADGIFTELLYREKDGNYEYKTDLPEIRKELRNYSDQNFKKTFFEEVEVQLMQMCAENKKLIKRSHQYVIAKNKVLSCILPEAYNFEWLGTKPPTDVVFRWTWQSKEWIEKYKDDLGRSYN